MNNLLLDMTNKTFDERENILQQACAQLGLDFRFVDNAVYYAKVFIQKRSLAGNPIVMMVCQSSDGAADAGYIGRSVVGRMHMQTPNNGNTNGFGEMWHNQSYKTVELASKKFDELVAKLKKEVRA